MLYQRKILDILKKPYELNEQSFDVLQKLAKDYPYCQTIQILLAKNLQQYDKLAFEKQVNKASAYAVDRRKFQRYISDRDKPSAPQIKEETPSAQPAKKENGFFEIPVETEPQPVPDISPEPSLKQQQPNTVIRPVEEKPTQQGPVIASGKLPETGTGKTPEKVPNEEEKKPPKGLLDIVKSRLREIRERNSKKEANKKKTAEESGKPISEDPGKISGIKEKNMATEESIPQPLAPKPKTNEELSQVFTRHERQAQKPDINFLIDKFLREEPKIKVKKEDLPEQQEDLSAPSTSEDPQLVTETLAQVYLKQGKKEKALDIYEKLCLKFPEKSSYFAKKIIAIKNEINI